MVTVCGTLSGFVQVAVVPGFTVICCGLKAKDLIVTVPGPAPVEAWLCPGGREAGQKYIRHMQLQGPVSPAARTVPGIRENQPYLYQSAGQGKTMGPGSCSPGRDMTGIVPECHPEQEADQQD